MTKEQYETEITDLTLRRERIKSELMQKYALRANRLHRYIAYKEGTSVGERLELDAEIASLEADRQSSKVQLMTLKAEARELRSKSFHVHLMDVMKEQGLDHFIDAARDRAAADLDAAGLGQAYRKGL